MRSALNKDFVRDILNSKGRFLSIVAIVALGVAFFIGIKSSPIVMKTSSDKYYDDNNLMDIRLISTLGLTEDDVNEIKKIDGVDKIFPTYSTDVISDYKNSEKVLKVHGLDITNLNKDNKNYINQLTLLEGRLPNKSGECVVEKPKIKSLEYEIGSKIKLSSGSENKLSDTLKTTEYTVVGYVQTPYYLSQEKGNSSIGSGVVEGAIMIPQSDFKSDVYTEIFLTVKGAKKLDTYSDEYFDLVETVTNKIEDIKDIRTEVRYKEILSKANKELKKAEDKLNKAKDDLLSGEKEYKENKLKSEKELEDAQNKINNYLAQISKGEKELKEQKLSANDKIKNGEAKIKNAEKEIENGEAKYKSSLKEFNKNKKLAESEFKKAENELNQLNTTINNLKRENGLIEEQLKNENLSDEEKIKLQTTLKENKSTLSILESKYESGNKELQNKKQELLIIENKLNKSKQELENSKIKIKEEKAKLQSSKKTAEEKFKSAEKKLADKKIEISKAQEELNENKVKVQNELAKAKKELEEGKEKIADGEEEIKDAKKEIDKIERPTWYILDRNSHQSFVEYKGCADSIDALAKVFPVFFFAVAALVCLTTMTRMVDEQRINIGTLKGLGYKTSQISKKYILYASLGCIIGSILGMIVGYTLFPTVIFFAYGMMYSIPNIIYIFSLPISIGITAIALIVITSSAILACYKELQETPAILMRPRAPKNGKRILLERIPFIWNRFGFISKVTIRNIFRYKKRFLMTVLGIAGCTALILTGFGIKDSIEIIVTGQYGRIFKYDMSIVTDIDLSNKKINKLKEDLSDFDEIKDFELFSYQNGNIKVNKTTKEISIVVPENLNKMDEFIHLQDRKSQKFIKLDDSGVVITEKMARDFNVKTGDNIDLINSNDKKSKVKIIGIAENYISHYIYMTPSYYEKVFNEDLYYNRLLGVLDNPNMKMEDDLSKKLFKIDNINGVSFNTAAKETFHHTIKNLNYVVLIMILSAGALAFVVLYNLTNVNISERIREIATIKVLGFYDNEVSAYIYRENIILTIIGTGVGIILGKILHQFIMITVEIQSMMFGRVISNKSYIIAAILTIILSCFVNFVMYYKLKNIKMVESLKSVD